MSVLQPRVSQLFDRKIILEIKIEKARQYGKEDHHFQVELSEIQRELDLRHFGVEREIKEQLEKLEVVHGTIWHHIGWIESVPEATEENSLSLAQLAINLVQLNKERHFLLEEIDRHFKQYVGKEKVSLYG